MTDTSLQDFLTDGVAVPDDAEERARFVVDSPDLAAWALRKMATIESRIAENRRLANEEAERIREWLDRVNGPLDRDRAWFESLVVGWWRDVLAKSLADAGGDWSKVREKSRSFPVGRVSARLVPPGPDYADETAAAAWLRENGFADLVAVVEKPKKADVKAAIGRDALVVRDGLLVNPETGEPVPGVPVPVVDDMLDAVSVTVQAAL